MQTRRRNEERDDEGEEEEVTQPMVHVDVEEDETQPYEEQDQQDDEDSEALRPVAVVDDRPPRAARGVRRDPRPRRFFFRPRNLAGTGRAARCGTARGAA